jgi:membrane protease YdiL (CAAX protease family)
VLPRSDVGSDRVGTARRFARALLLACAIPLVLGGAGALLARPALTEPDALGVEALAEAAELGLAALAAASLSRQRLGERLGLARGRLRGRSALLAVLGLLGLSHAVESVVELAARESSPGLARFQTALAGHAPGELLFPLAALTLGSALGEELFFRGLVQRGLERTLGCVGAIAVAALAFGAAHGDWVHGSAAALLGLYLGALAQAAGSIRPAIAAHAANNALAVLEASGAAPAPPWALAAGLLLAACGGLAIAAQLRSHLDGARGPRVPQELP